MSKEEIRKLLDDLEDQARDRLCVEDIKKLVENAFEDNYREGFEAAVNPKDLETIRNIAGTSFEGIVEHTAKVEMMWHKLMDTKLKQAIDEAYMNGYSVRAEESTKFLLAEANPLRDNSQLVKDAIKIKKVGLEKLYKKYLTLETTKDE